MKFFKRLISMYGVLILGGFIDLIFNADWDWREIGNWQAWLIAIVAILVIGVIGTVALKIGLWIKKICRFR